MSDITKRMRIVDDNAGDPTQYATPMVVTGSDGNPIDLNAGGGQTITSVTATALPAGVTPTATLAEGVLTIGIPAGEKGDPGTNGSDGKPGTNGTNGVGVQEIELTTDAAGKLTAATWTDTNGGTHAATVSVKQADAPSGITE